MTLHRLALLPLLAFLSPVSSPAQLGSLDTGAGASGLLQTIDRATLAEQGRSHAWLRIRGLPDPTNPARAAEVEKERKALKILCALGLRPIGLMRWEPDSWTAGARSGDGQRMPIDLREMFQRAKIYAAAYRECMAFEFDNEADISAIEDNPETYAAFLKACYWGVHAEDRAPRVPAAGVWRPGAPGVPAFHRWDAGWRSMAVMAPMALPPGPYFAQLLRNDLLSYTDAINYHFYGYAEDFSDVYRRFEEAVAAASETRVRSGEPGHRKRKLPVLLTEYGYGGLTAEAAGTVAGRVGQWAWFRDVGRQIEELRIAGPMAFYLQPYYENKAREFGLTLRAAGAGSAFRKTEPAADGTEFSAGGLTFRAEDFQVHVPESWMRRIGAGVGRNETAPALAWLLERSGTHPYRPRDWTVFASEPSPIVIDFIAGAGLLQFKNYGGYLGQGAPRDGATVSRGEVVLYNFGPVRQRGRLEFSRADTVRSSDDLMQEIELAPLGRVTVPVTLRIPAARFERVDWRVRFVPAAGGTPPAVFATAFYPCTAGMQETVISRFDELAGAGAHNRALLRSRPLVPDEPETRPDGRWLVSRGGRVVETDGVWRFHVPAADREQRSSSAELPLPDGFVFPPGALVQLAYRLAEPAGPTVWTGRYLRVYFRTANGNLYGVWPWSRATAQWGWLMEARENYTPMSYGRVRPPLTFADATPVSLVLMAAQGPEPTVFEIKDPRISTVGMAR